MSDNTPSNKHPSRLRRRAEASLGKDSASLDELSVEEARNLVHELRVHQVELELQNEELRDTQSRLASARDQFQSLYEDSPAGYLSHNREGLITGANQTAARMLGTSQAELNGARLYRFVSEADHAAFFEHRRALARNSEPQSCEVRLMRGDGAIFDARLESLVVSDGTNRPVYRTVVSDITGRKEAERGWRLAYAIVEATAQGLVVFDTQWHIARINHAFTELTGFPAPALQGEAIDTVVMAVNVHGGIDGLAEILGRQGTWRGELDCRRRDGSTFPAWGAFTAIHDAFERLTYFAGLLVDITETKRAEARIRHQAYHDDITGLPNRSFFVEQLALAARTAHRHSTQLALLFLDLDRFKQANDWLGHDAGDDVLREIASRLTACVRENDLVARIGGDEFAIVLLDVGDAQAAARVADKILNRLAEPLKIGRAVLKCQASIGIALHPSDAQELDALRRHADMAMYDAKRAGRNCYRFFTASMTAHALQRARLEHEIEAGLAREEFTLVYQPILRTASAQLAGAEALLRWQHPERGMLRPAHFLSVSEDTGQIRALGDWVFRAACREAAEWPGAAPFVAINVSACQLRDADSLAGVPHLLRDSGLAPERLVVELTESAAMNGSDAGLQRMRELRGQGVRLAMDDFGTGYSALANLKHLATDILKIDASFVQDVEASADAARLVEAIIALGHGLRMAVIGEGVETEGQLEFLRHRGCDYVQGRFLSPPLSTERFRALLAGERAPTTAIAARRDTRQHE